LIKAFKDTCFEYLPCFMINFARSDHAVEENMDGIAHYYGLYT
jgi:hypothetical protein